MKSKESKQQGGRFLGMLFVRLGGSLLGNLLTGKETIRAGEGTSRSGQNCQCPSPFNKFEIQKYYQNEHNFNGIYSKNNLPKTKDEASVINLDENESIETHWIALHVNNNDITYFRVENIPKKKKEN